MNICNVVNDLFLCVAIKMNHPRRRINHFVTFCNLWRNPSGFGRWGFHVNWSQCLAKVLRLSLAAKPVWGSRAPDVCLSELTK